MRYYPNGVSKSNPTHSDLHVSTPLTNISVGWAQANQGKYMAQGLFPLVGVNKKSDKYYVWDKGDLLRSQAQRRAPGAEAAVGGHRISTDNYECERWALARDIDDPTRANADPAVSNLDARATQFITDQIELAHEVEFVTDFFAPSVWTGASSTSDMTGAASPASTAASFMYWNDAASTPIQDIRGELSAVESRTGYRPNVLALGPQVEDALADHPDIVDRIKYTGGGAASVDIKALLAQMFGLDRVVTLRAVRNTGTEGGTDSVRYLAGKHALLMYVTPTPGLDIPTAGYTFVWTGAGTPLQGARIKRYRLDRNESDRVEGERWTDFKVVASELGAFFSGAVA